MQCKEGKCPDSVAVTGINIKAAEFAQCSFKNPKDIEAETPLNPKSIKAGTDINIRCQWDTDMLVWNDIQMWEQGMDGVTPNSKEMDDIRKNGYPNNSHIKTYPYSCLAGMGRMSKVEDHEDQSSLKTKGWK
jgi:hypothetical protein